MSRDDTIRAMASAKTLSEQIALAAELDAQDDGLRRTASAERDLDWASTTVAETFAPVPVHTHHTAATDWLAEADTTGGDNAHHAILAEASVWFQRLDADVRADAAEYVEQARGMARRTAGKYGEQADTAARSFVEYAAFLNRQVLAASGVDQVQQIVDARENPSQTPLPPDVFDNFAPPVHPINQAVDGQQTEFMGPGMQEAISESATGPTAGRPSEHDDGQGEISEPYLETPSEPGASRIASALAPPSMAINHSYTFEQWLQREAAAEDQDLSSEFAEEPDASGEQEAGRLNAAPDAGYNDWVRSKQGSKAGGAAPFVREAASGLDEVQQVVNPHEDPKPTSLPTDVAFPIEQPWPEEDAGTGTPSRHDAVRKQADTWQGGNAPAAVPGGETPVANSPATTPPRADGGDYSRGLSEGRADAQDGAAPSFSDVSSSVSDYVRGYSEGFGNTEPAGPPQDVPASMGGDNGQAANFARIEQQREKPLVMASTGLTVSAALVSRDITADVEFKRGYRYARSWKPGAELVAFGSQGEEAGIYAGITDNPKVQAAWVKAHREGAKDHPELERRLRSHKLVTGNLRSRDEGLTVKGLYVQAATSLDLDTMAPSTMANPQGATPFMGPGTVPPLANAPGSPADPGGPAPYNGAEPMGAPVTPDPLIQPPASPPEPDPESTNGVSMVGDSSLINSPRAQAFRKQVQANRLALRQNREK